MARIDITGGGLVGSVPRSFVRRSSIWGNGGRLVRTIRATGCRVVYQQTRAKRILLIIFWRLE